MIQEKILKKIRETDLGRMKSTKHGNFGGVWARTSYSAFFVLDSILNILRPDVIVEIGTWRGGLSCYYLKDSFVQKDSLSGDSWAFVYNYIGKNSALVYCDGGNKERELEIYRKTIMPGSIIGCHDYGTEVDPEKVREFMGDNFVEIFTMEQIKELGNLQQFWMRK